MAGFSQSTARVLRTCGYHVSASVATRRDYKDAALTQSVFATGQWEVRRGGRKIAEGQERDAALAACDANEAMWGARRAQA